MIYLGADHRGHKLKEEIRKYLKDLGYNFNDLGALEYNENDDYPDFAKAVAEKVVSDPENRGILICGSGIGVAIVANKIKGIRAGTAFSPEQVRAAVNDEDLNILAISADYISESDAKEIVKRFLGSKFSGKTRHVRRVNKIIEMEVNL